MLRDTRWFLVTLSALILAACNGSDPLPSGATEPAPECLLPDDAEGEPCSCPGVSICPDNDQNIWFRCLEGGTWEKTDASCVLADASDVPLVPPGDAARQANPGSGDAAALIPCPPACGPDSN
jgi:hypothetical protein